MYGTCEAIFTCLKARHPFHALTATVRQLYVADTKPHVSQFFRCLTAFGIVLWECLTRKLPYEVSCRVLPPFPFRGSGLAGSELTHLETCTVP